jgi:hypothetical protein
MSEILTETRDVSGFNQVSIRGNTCSAEVVITQGDREGLTIKAPAEYLRRIQSRVAKGKLTLRLVGTWLEELQDALSTCMNRPKIVYILYVSDLTGLEVQCASIVRVERIETPHLFIKFDGTGDFRLGWLAAESLDVHHSGLGMMRIAGQVEEQSVLLNGVGSYNAAELASQRARVRLTGAGMVRLHVTHSLDATLRGTGSLRYSGNAQVHKHVSGPGQILHVSETQQARV